MGKNQFRVSYRAVLPLAVAALALFGPVAAYAQTDEPIIMSCDSTPVHVTLTINLTAKTIQVEMNDTSPQFQQVPHDHVYTYPISQITDQEIKTATFGQADQYYVLNRFTGDFRMITPAYPNNPNLYGACQRQQKQF